MTSTNFYRNLASPTPEKKTHTAADTLTLTDRQTKTDTQTDRQTKTNTQIGSCLEAIIITIRAYDTSKNVRTEIQNMIVV